MDGVVTGGLIAGGVSLGVNAIGWVITLVRGKEQEARIQGAFQQKVEDVCADVQKVEDKVDKVDKKIDSHIMNHPGRGARK